MPSTYIICAAGEGTRFHDTFGTLPKACIRLHETTLLEWSLRSLPIYADDTLIVITQKKHRVRDKLILHIQNIYPFLKLHWLEIDQVTRGQLETALLARSYSPPENSVVIFNCDTFFQSKTLFTTMQNYAIDGIIPCARASGSSWSFCRTDGTPKIIEVKEKDPISEWASVGFYYFRDGEHFFHAAETMLKKSAVHEYYVAPLYQEYINAGKNIVIDEVSLFKPMGTPEQIETFWSLSIDTVKLQNTKPVLVIDLDDTITIEDPHVPYPDKTPNVDVIQKMQEFHDAGWEIIIYSSRRMETCKNEEAKILANIGKITLDWLAKHNVPYDGLRFGKPYARNGFYVDDKAMRPDDFLKLAPK